MSDYRNPLTPLAVRGAFKFADVPEDEPHLSAVTKIYSAALRRLHFLSKDSPIYSSAFIRSPKGKKSPVLSSAFIRMVFKTPPPVELKEPPPVTRKVPRPHLSAPQPLSKHARPIAKNYTTEDINKMMKDIFIHRFEENSCKKILRVAEINPLFIRFKLNELIEALDATQISSFHKTNYTLIKAIILTFDKETLTSDDEKLMNIIASCNNPP